MHFSYLSLLLASLEGALAATAADWRSRSIYQIVTDRYARTDSSKTAECDTATGKYCGGTWQGIINNLDYIQNMGFTAIWISPVTENLPQYSKDGAAYHGYWQQNINELNSNFGTADDLKALSKAVHDRDMYLMVDVAVNHYGWFGDSQSVQYEQLIPFNDEKYYHSYCDASAVGANETACWLGDQVVSLPDLKTEDDNVRAMWQDWITALVNNYTIDGLRLDSAGNVEPEFFPGFSKAAGVFLLGEVFSGLPSYVCSYTEVLSGTLNYPTYFPLTRGFASSDASLEDLVNELSSLKSICNDTTTMGSFSENHDNPRFPSNTNDTSLVKNVLAYTILTDGIPIIYEGQEQHLSGGSTPFNREAIWLSSYNTTAPLYNYILGLNLLRQRAANVSEHYLTHQAYPFYNDNHTLAIRKGWDGSQMVLLLNNDGAEGVSRSVSLQSTDDTGFFAGDVVTDVISCMNSTVGSHGELKAVIKAGIPNVFYLAEHLKGTTICQDNGTTTNPTIATGDPQHSAGERIAVGTIFLVILAAEMALGVLFD